ncbi:TAXI family TRAP transporter solute-binding subunit [Phascolarctobacterium sp.]|uniref:TAXI family TRAP transporter solute-binding subunit n=1 Tax=Phascolarctobacterium sp. TaxID=2049039 RepID=UPI002A82656A|nr:TAXI family TRAP transporter solute-binding subunit [Phascolarctobacterium sp.]MDY5045286.1 TAXI family TRAP transporter solute-binding subunit [Phascolarctobacterium sp.]
MKKFLALMMMIVMAFTVAACGGGGDKKADNKAAAGKVDRSKEFITVLTGPTSGIYFPIGGAFSKVVGEMGYKTSATATGATAENINAILTGKGEMAIAMSDSVIQAVEAFGAYQGKPKAENLRAMMGLWPNVCQIVTTKDSGITKFTDLKGKRVGVGAPNSGVELNARMMFEAHGMTYKDAKVDYLSYGEAIDQIKNGQCDVAFVTSGLGNATIKELGTAKEIVFVPVEGEALKKLTAKYPFYVEWKIPKETYGTKVDTTTAAVMNIMLVSKNLSDDVVYDLLTGIYSQKGLETIGASHATAKREIKPETALRGIKGTSVKLHPGAEKYYKEKGMLK